MQSIQQMHRDNREEVWAARVGEAQVRSAMEDSGRELATAQAELASANQRVSELTSALHQLEDDRSRLSAEAHNARTELDACREDLREAGATISALKGELAGTQCSLAAQTEQVMVLRG